MSDSLQPHGDCSVPGFPVPHCLPVIAQTHVHCVCTYLHKTYMKNFTFSSPCPLKFSISNTFLRNIFGNILGNLLYNKINRQEYNMWLFIVALILNGRETIWNITSGEILQLNRYQYKQSVEYTPTTKTTKFSHHLLTQKKIHNVQLYVKKKITEKCVKYHPLFGQKKILK